MYSSLDYFFMSNIDKHRITGVRHIRSRRGVDATPSKNLEYMDHNNKEDISPLAFYKMQQRLF